MNFLHQNAVLPLHRFQALIGFIKFYLKTVLDILNRLELGMQLLNDFPLTNNLILLLLCDHLHISNLLVCQRQIPITTLQRLKLLSIPQFQLFNPLFILSGIGFRHVRSSILLQSKNTSILEPQLLFQVVNDRLQLPELPISGYYHFFVLVNLLPHLVQNLQIGVPLLHDEFYPLHLNNKCSVLFLQLFLEPFDLLFTLSLILFVNPNFTFH